MPAIKHPPPDIHARVQQAITSLKQNDMSLQAVMLIYQLPEATAKRIIREVRIMRGTNG